MKTKFKAWRVLFMMGILVGCNHTKMSISSSITPIYHPQPGDPKITNIFWYDTHISFVTLQEGCNDAFCFDISPKLLNMDTGELYPFLPQKYASLEAIDIAYWKGDSYELLGITTYEKNGSNVYVFKNKELIKTLLHYNSPSWDYTGTELAVLGTNSIKFISIETQEEYEWDFSGKLFLQDIKMSPTTRVIAAVAIEDIDNLALNNPEIEKQQDIYLLYPDDKTYINLTQTPNVSEGTALGSLSWSFDGKFILTFIEDRGQKYTKIQIINIETKCYDIYEIPAFMNSISFSPDGKSIVFSDLSSAQKVLISDLPKQQSFCK